MKINEDGLNKELMPLISKIKKTKVNSIFSKLNDKGIPLASYLDSKNTIIARNVCDFKKSALEITKVLNGIFVETNIIKDELHIVCEEVLNYEIVKNKLIRFNNEEYVQSIFDFAKRENKNVVLLEVHGLFNYNITIY